MMVNSVYLTGPSKMEYKQSQLFNYEKGITIKVLACGVCGTDGHIIDGKVPINYPIIPGHEVYGKVVYIGKHNQVESVNGTIKKDDIVALIPGKPCNNCEYCNALPNEEVLCPNRTTYGLNINAYENNLCGGYSQYLIVREGYKVFHIPKSWPIGFGAVIETVGVGVHVANRIEKIAEPVNNRGLTAIIFGAGAIGFFTAIALKKRNINVAFIDPIISRRKRVEKWGFKAFKSLTVNNKKEIIEQVGGIEPDIVVEAAGTLKAFNDAIELVRRGGVVAEVGNFVDIGSVSLKPSQICRKQISLLGIALAEESTFYEAAEILNMFINHPNDILIPFDLDDFQNAIKNLKYTKDGLKAVLIPKDDNNE